MEDVLDEQPNALPPVPQWWPSVFMGGFGGAAVVVAFNFISSGGGPTSLIYFTVALIVLNSTLTHYRSKPGSHQSYLMGFMICMSTFSLMMAVSSIVKALWFGITYYDFSISFDYPLNSIPMLLGGGLLASAVISFLSKRYKHQ